MIVVGERDLTYDLHFFTFCLSRRCIFQLPQYHIMPHFDALKIYSCRKHCEKREIARSEQFLLFSQCFLPYMVLNFHFKCTLKMLPAICFNLDV